MSDIALKQLDLGRRGEEFAVAYLEQFGYRIVATNFSLPVGRNRIGARIHVEVDIVAYDGPVLCFIEVKSRASDWFAPPQANVDRRKQRQITRAARAYRRLLNITTDPYRYDVITVVFGEDRDSPQIELLRKYWTEDQLRKRIWSDHYYD
ncbi:MAG TPA: YraN family protein [Pyrinomonadaceae bacterium]|nr:YraN family protein [Pyrinomonadaceae bacterium]